MSSSQPKVIFIGGASRSGSTLLDRMLGQVPGVFSTGELRRLWDRGLAGEHLCGCGTVLVQCPFWADVLRSSYGEISPIEAKRMRGERAAVERFRYVPSLSFKALRGKEFLSRLARHHSNLERLYQNIEAESGAEVIVDSSKAPLHGFILMALDSIDAFVVHLVRDSRAVAYSQQRERVRPDSPHAELMMRRMPARTSSRKWLTFNGLTQLLGARYRDRYLRVRYEDFTLDPEGVIKQILQHAGVDAGTTFIRDQVAHLSPNHTVSGNPLRFKNGEIKIRTDSEWRSSMETRDRKVVTALTLPLLVSYGYVPARRPHERSLSATA